MKVTFKRSLLMNQPYAGRGSIGGGEESIIVSGRRLWPLPARIALFIATFAGVEVVLAYGSAISKSARYVRVLDLRTVGDLVRVVVGILVAWSVASALGRKRVTETFSLDKVKKIRVNGKRIRLHLADRGRVDATVTGAQKGVDAFLRDLLDKACLLR